MIRKSSLSTNLLWSWSLKWTISLDWLFMLENIYLSWTEAFHYSKNEYAGSTCLGLCVCVCGGVVLFWFCGVCCCCLIIFFLFVFVFGFAFFYTSFYPFICFCREINNSEATPPFQVVTLATASTDLKIISTLIRSAFLFIYHNFLISWLSCVQIGQHDGVRDFSI